MSKEKLTSLHTAGPLRKLQVQLKPDNLADYQLPVGEQLLPLNSLLGQKITLHAMNKIQCIHCGRITKKSFNQGYCYPCFTRLAQCDLCIVKPELCHYHKGTCREPEWGEQFCMQRHIVYLANSSGVKVGITRTSQIPVRWIDQGAIQALPIFNVASRQLSGFIEQIFRQEVSDKTNWRALLKGDVQPVDLPAIRDQLFSHFTEQVQTLQNKYGIQAVQPLSNNDETDIHYPVNIYPVKITSFNFDKTPAVSGILQGIKGQYLILDTGVLNIRKFAGYHVEVTI